MSTTSEINARVLQFITDLDLAHQIVHGGAGVSVPTDGGLVRSFASVINQLDADVESAANTVINQVYTARDQAVNAGAAAAGSATTASNAATTATDQASAAQGYASAASGSASTASTQAGIAAGHASTATGKAGEALASANAAAQSANVAVNSPGTSASSSTSLTIGTGSKALALAQTGKAFVVNQWVYLVDSAAPADRWLHGTITAFNSGTGAMTVNVVRTNGSGTNAAWLVMPATPAYDKITADSDGNVTFTARVNLGASVGSIANTGFNQANTRLLAATPATDGAFMYLERAGIFGAYFGIDTDNKFKVGGASMGGTSYELWHNGNLPNTGLMQTRGSIDQSALDTATLPGYYIVGYPGYSIGMLAFNPGGSTGVAQLDFHYNGSIRYRNKTDSTTWSGWRDVWTSATFNPANYAALAGATFTAHVIAERVAAGYDSGQAGSINALNWFRSAGATGWYNATYGGGINMQDTTWVRVYGDKGFLIQSGMSSYGMLHLMGTGSGDQEVSMNFRGGNETPDQGWTVGRYSDRFFWYKAGAQRMQLTNGGDLFIGGTLRVGASGASPMAGGYAVWHAGNVDPFRYETFTANADLLPPNRSAFTYANNAPHTGPIAHFDASGYGLQLNGAYNGGGNSLAFRTRNGDSGIGWNGWKNIWHDGNFNPAGYALLSGAAFGGAVSVSAGLTVSGGVSVQTGGLSIGGNGVWHAGNFNPNGYLPLGGGTLSGDLVANVVSASRFATGWDSGVSGSVSASNWFRSSGASGWYNETYSGGWFMSDVAYLRSYAGKGLSVGVGAEDPFGTIGVTRVADGNTYSYYGMTRSGQVAWGMGINTGNSLVFGNGSTGINGVIGAVATLTTGGTFTANNIGMTSDERVKSDWADLPVDFVDRLAEVKIGTYNHRLMTGRHVGASAQSLLPLLPEAVLRHGDGDDEMLAISYGPAAMVAAGMLARRLIAAERRIARLENA